MITLAVLDMAGTTVLDGGLVERAFTAAVGAVGVRPESAEYPGMLEHVRATMGESKITVFRALLDGDEERAQAANLAFEQAYADLVDQGHCAPVPGATEVIEELRHNGIRVALGTGFAPPTRDRLLAALGWRDLVDLSLTPAEAGRGRPHPDLVLTAVLRLGIEDVRQVAVVGDTTADVHSGLRAGAGVVAGVLTGAHGRDALSLAGATHVLDSVRELPALLINQKH